MKRLIAMALDLTLERIRERDASEVSGQYIISLITEFQTETLQGSGEKSPLLSDDNATFG